MTDRKLEYECDLCEESDVSCRTDPEAHLSKQVLVNHAVRGELVDVSKRSLRCQKLSKQTTHHDAADGLARELQDAAQEREFVIRQLVFDTQGHEGLQLGLAIRDAVIVCTEQIVQHLRSACAMGIAQLEECDSRERWA